MPVGSVRRCDIGGCSTRHYCRGFCRRHYRAFMAHGDPLVRIKVEPGNGSRINWLREHATYGGDGCLTWPFSRMQNGYGDLSVAGKYTTAHREMCILVNGPPPHPKSMALHSCHKGHEGCVHPRHLRWGTAKENQMDRVEAGTSKRGKGKLSIDDVREVRMLTGKLSRRKIAMKFGVSDGTIQQIQIGKNWAWLQ